MFSWLEERLRDAIDTSVEWGQIDLRFSESLLAKDQCEFISVNMNSQQNKHTTSKPLLWRLMCFNMRLEVLKAHTCVCEDLDSPERWTVEGGGSKIKLPLLHDVKTESRMTCRVTVICVTSHRIVIRERTQK
jgi:hypothetical protein